MFEHFLHARQGDVSVSAGVRADWAGTASRPSLLVICAQAWWRPPRAAGKRLSPPVREAAPPGQQVSPGRTAHEPMASPRVLAACGPGARMAPGVHSLCLGVLIASRWRSSACRAGAPIGHRLLRRRIVSVLGRPLNSNQAQEQLPALRFAKAGSLVQTAGLRALDFPGWSGRRDSNP